MSVIQRDIYHGEFVQDYGDTELRKLRKKFNASFNVVKHAFREYKTSKGQVVTSEFQKLLYAIDTLSLSTVLCKRSFNAMNDIYASVRS
jgi:hypothetical protein